MLQLLIENQSETQNGRNGQTKITAVNLTRIHYIQFYSE